MTDIRPPSFFFLAHIFAQDTHLHVSQKWSNKCQKVGMESGETGILLFFSFFVITMHCHSWLKMICS